MVICAPSFPSADAVLRFFQFPIGICEAAHVTVVGRRFAQLESVTTTALFHRNKLSCCKHMYWERKVAWCFRRKCTEPRFLSPLGEERPAFKELLSWRKRLVPATKELSLSTTRARSQRRCCLQHAAKGAYHEIYYFGKANLNTVRANVL